MNDEGIYRVRTAEQKAEGFRCVDVTKTRQQAIESGDKYFKGYDCEYGHGGVRYLTNSSCVICNSNSRLGTDMSSVELRRNIEDRLEEKRLREEWGDL